MDTFKEPGTASTFKELGTANTFKELGTEGAIAGLYERTAFKPCSVPCFDSGEGRTFTASRLLMEGIDFDLTFFPFKHLGYKAVVLATGELMCNMAVAKTLKISLAVSSKLDFPEVSQIWDGVVAAAEEYGYESVSLELVPSLTGLAISVAAGGCQSREQALSRPQAKSMDLICISNNAGAAFLGEQILRKSSELLESRRKGKLEKYKQLVGAYLKPELSPYTLNALSESGITPSFGYFCTKGLQDAFRSIAADTGLGAKLYVEKIPFAGGSIDAAKELGTDPLQAALKGGDDNCLLFVVPIGLHDKLRHDFQNWDVIGHLARPEVGTVIVSPDGLEHVM